MKMKRRILLMNTICLTSLRILHCSHSIMKIALSQQVSSHVRYRQTMFLFRDFESCKPTEKRIHWCFNTFDHLSWHILEKSYFNGKGKQIRFCKIRNPTAFTGKKKSSHGCFDTRMHLLPFWGKLKIHIICSTSSTWDIKKTGHCDS